MSTKSRGYVNDHVTSKPSDRDETVQVVVRKRRRSLHDALDRRREKEALIRSLIDRG
jgi:hypothetical protein